MNNYGGLIQAPDSLPIGKTPLDFRTGVAEEIGLHFLRDAYLFAKPKELKSLQTKYPIMLNINTDVPGTGGLKFATDLTAYEKELRTLFRTFTVKPIVAVCENESMNIRYYNDTAEHYMAQFRVFARVCKDFGIASADSGATMQPLIYLYAQTLPEAEKKAFLQRNRINVSNPELIKSAQFVDYVLTKIRYTSATYTNFHWYYRDGDNLEDFISVIQFLRKKTGKPIITNEIGMQDYNPKVPARFVKIARQNNIEFTCFYSEKHLGETQPLHNPDGTITILGWAYYSAILQ